MAMVINCVIYPPHACAVSTVIGTCVFVCVMPHKVNLIFCFSSPPSSDFTCHIELELCHNPIHDPVGWGYTA